MVSGSAPLFGGGLRRDQSGILQPDLIGDHDQLLAPSRHRMRGAFWLSIWATAITLFIMPLCSRRQCSSLRFDRAYRAAFGH
jgi:hypothetical protein